MSKFKSVFIVALFMVTLLAGPASFYARAQTAGTSSKETNMNVDADTAFKAVGQSLGMMRQFGASGEALGQVLQLMFENFAYMNTTEKLPGTYVLNGSIIKDKVTTTHSFGSGKVTYYTPYGIYNCRNSTNSTYKWEYPYLKVVENGTVNITRTEGAAVTFIIWDNDATFINAIDKLIETAREVQAIDASGGSDDEKKQAATNQLIEAITYFLIHINDIVTGDEVIICNMIGYTSYALDFINGVVNGTWYSTEKRQKTDKVLLDDAYPLWKEEFSRIAMAIRDEKMLWAINEGYEQRLEQNYTRFSFDLIELWLKNFQVSINVEEILNIVNGGPSDAVATDIFEELDIEFYIISHHFSNWYLYNDSMILQNDVPDVEFNSTTGLIERHEVTDYILFRGGEFYFKEPVYDLNAKSMKWGVGAKNLNFRIIPIGLQESQTNLTASPIEQMEYFEMGFTFEPWKDQTVKTDEFSVTTEGDKKMGIARVKLDQSFGKWNGGAGPLTPRINATSGADLDLTTVYMSTMLHFHLYVKNDKSTTVDLRTMSDEQTAQLLNDTSYVKEKGSLFVGDAQNTLPLAEVNITGPAYTQGTESYPAKSTIIPQVFATYDAQAQQTYVQKDQTVGVLGANLSVQFSIMYYAVSYPTFGSQALGVSGQEIIHDPTFSLFITIENPGIMAIILVVGVVALVGIAAMLITKKKNAAA